MITQEKLKKTLCYNCDTGIFLWRGGITATKEGSEAGFTTREGYRAINIARKHYKAHRLAWFYVYGEWPNQIDHINGVRDDNRIENLRNVKSSDNSKNRKLSVRNKSRVAGVHWNKKESRWAVRVNNNNKERVFLGYFDNIFDAAAAAISARKRFGYHENNGRKVEAYPV